MKAPAIFQAISDAFSRIGAQGGLIEEGAGDETSGDVDAQPDPLLEEIDGTIDENVEFSEHEYESMEDELNGENPSPEDYPSGHEGLPDLPEHYYEEFGEDNGEEENYDDRFDGEANGDDGGAI